MGLIRLNARQGLGTLVNISLVSYFMISALHTL